MPCSFKPFMPFQLNINWCLRMIESQQMNSYWLYDIQYSFQLIFLNKLDNFFLTFGMNGWIIEDSDHRFISYVRFHRVLLRESVILDYAREKSKEINYEYIRCGSGCAYIGCFTRNTHKKKIVRLNRSRMSPWKEGSAIWHLDGSAWNAFSFIALEAAPPDHRD